MDHRAWARLLVKHWFTDGAVVPLANEDHESIAQSVQSSITCTIDWSVSQMSLVAGVGRFPTTGSGACPILDEEP